MLRRLSLAAAITAALSPVSVSALGLGEIHLKSALNQTFNADIDLVAVKAGEIDGVKVGLAPAEAYAEAGVERPFLLSKLRFKPIRLRGGKAVIRVTSKEPIREPFLDFLIEVNWPQGRLVREYTVLLDPPASVGRKLEPVAAPIANRTRAVQSRAASSREAASQRPAFHEGASNTGLIRRVGKGIEYGPVPKHDTLWSIAKRMKVPGASTPQVVMALLRNNPSAFIGQNVNNLKAGVILRLPDLANVTTLSRREAWRQFRAQTAQYFQPEAPKSRLALASAEVPGKQTAGKGGAGGGSAKDVARIEKEVALLREATESRRLNDEELRARVKELEAQLQDIQRLITVRSEQYAQLQKMEGGATSAAAAEQAASEGAPSSAAEASPEPEKPAVSGEEATPAETAPVAEGAESGEEATPAVEAAAGSQTAGGAAEETPSAREGEENAAPVEPPASEATPETVAEAGSATTGTGDGAEAATETQTETGSEATAPEVAGEGSPSMPEAETETPASTEVAGDQLGKNETAPEESVVSPVTPEPEAVAPPPEKTGLLDNLGDTFSKNPAMLAGGAGVIALLGALGWMFARRRREAEDEMEESILLGGGTGDIETAETGHGGLAENSEETSFLSDFAASDFKGLDEESGEVDPISEADVYIAYGRYQQAEDLVRQAIDQSPDRLDLRYKLLEIQSAAGEKAAFAKTAKALLEEGADEKDPEGWDKVIKMGRELLPEDPMFASGGAGGSEGPGLSVVGGGAAAAAAVAGAMASGAQEAATFELPEEGASEALGEGMTEVGPDAGAVDGEVDASAAAAELDDLDFTTGDEEGLEEGAAHATDEIVAEAPAGADDTEFDLDFDLSEIESEIERGADQASAEAANDEEDDNALDFDLGDLKLPHETALDEAAGAADVAGEATDEVVSDLERSLSEAAQVSEAEMPAGGGAPEEGLDLEGIDLAGLDVEDKEEASVAEEIDLSDVDFDELGLGLEEDTEEKTKAGGVLADIGNEEDLEEEVDTKLDLARAYVDMGDADGAKGILGEVIEEGNEVQKKEAQTLLEQIAS